MVEEILVVTQLFVNEFFVVLLPEALQVVLILFFPRIFKLEHSVTILLVDKLLALVINDAIHFCLQFRSHVYESLALRICKIVVKKEIGAYFIR